MLEEKKAVAEAFGYYFNLEGQIVYKTSSIGVDIKDLDRIGTIMAVAGGKSKADAITAVMAQHRHTILVTDEGAAKAIAEKLPE